MEIYCKNCGKKYDDGIENCPLCEAPTIKYKEEIVQPIKKEDMHKTGLYGQILFGSFIVIFWAWVIGTQNDGIAPSIWQGLFTAVASYNPFWYINKNNKKSTKIIVWLFLAFMIFLFMGGSSK